MDAIDRALFGDDDEATADDGDPKLLERVAAFVAAKTTADADEEALHTSHGHLHLSPASISTMTVLVYLDVAKIDLPAVVAGCSEREAQAAEVLGSNFSVNHAKSFYNCITLKFTVDKKGRAVKVFSNGRLHLTGPRSIEDAMAIGEAVCGFIGGILGQTLRVVDFDVQLVNSNFAIQHAINLVELSKASNAQGYHTRLDPERHAGVQIRVVCASGRAVSCIVFHTGNVLITGYNQPGQFVEVLRVLLSLLGSGDGMLTPLEDARGCKRPRRATEFDYGAFIVLR